MNIRFTRVIVDNSGTMLKKKFVNILKEKNQKVMKFDVKRINRSCDIFTAKGPLSMGRVNKLL